jgi:hypothetical protein
MARTVSRFHVPLDVNFFDDGKVVDAGEAAGWLYLAMMTKAKTLDTDGVLSRAQIDRLGVKGWPKRLARLVEVGLVDQAQDHYGLVGWLNWNESAAAREARREADRKRKAEKGGSR